LLGSVAEPSLDPSENREVASSSENHFQNQNYDDIFMTAWGKFHHYRAFHVSMAYFGMLYPVKI
jgi:hypothetical protein